MELVDTCNHESGMHIQIFFAEPKCFDSVMAHYVNFTGLANYIALAGAKEPGTEEKAGYFGGITPLTAQEMGLNTCWVAMTHGKSQAVINTGEKQVCLIALGYGAVKGVMHHNKPISEVCNCADTMPAWFAKGMEAVMLAPTAVNQQKFYFTLQGDDVTAAVKGSGFYTMIDLGIVKYHFETVTEKKVI